MTTHEIRLDRYCAQAEGVRGRLVLGTWNSYGIEQLQLVLGDGWEGRTVTAVFHGPKTSAGTTVLAGSDGLVPVPPEATADAGYGTITIVGVDADSQRISVDVPYVVKSHAPVDGAQPDPTPDQWQQFVAAVKADADRAEQAAWDAADSAAAAAKSAEAAGESAQKAEQAGADIGAAKDDALEAIQQAQDTGVQAVQTATTTGVQAVQQAHQAALDDIATDRQQALADIEETGYKQTAAITSGGAAALEAIGRTEQAAIGQVQQAGTAQVAAIETAGAGQLDKINAANALVPTPTEADAGKAVVVRADGSGYELGKVQTDAYTRAESDARYAPIAAAIRPTVSGNPATLEHSVAWAMQGLSVYGKSTQDGTPSPESPVPIVSAGDGGSIDLTVSNGASLSQSMTIATPNGLPGIPVNSGGNYTDAEGQQWVCDEIDYAREVYVQSVERREFDGSENWNEYESNGTSENLLLLSINLSSTDEIKNYWGAPSEILSNRFMGGVSGSDLVWHITAGEGISSNNNGVKATLYVAVNRTTANTIDEWKEFLKTNHLICEWVRNTPIENPLSSEKLTAYRTLHTYYGTTVVSTAEDVAGLTARAIVDPVAYIDSKIQSAVNPVNQAILEAKTNV